MVKNLPANARDGGFDPWVGDDHLEKEMATRSSILAWEMPWTEEPGVGYRPRGRKESNMTE